MEQIVDLSNSVLTNDQWCKLPSNVRNPIATMGWIFTSSIDNLIPLYNLPLNENNIWIIKYDNLYFKLKGEPFNDKHILKIECAKSNADKIFKLLQVKKVNNLKL